MIKKEYILGIIVFLGIIILLFLNSPTNTPSTKSIQTYNGTSYSFDYPNTWKVSWKSEKFINNEPGVALAPTNGSLIVEMLIFDATNLKLNENGDVINGTNLNDYMVSLVEDFSQVQQSEKNNTTYMDPNYKLIYNHSINVNGMSGFDLLFYRTTGGLSTDSHAYNEIVILQNGNKFYEMEILYYPPIIKPYAHDDLMIIVNSIKFK